MSKLKTTIKVAPIQYSKPEGYGKGSSFDCFFVFSDDIMDHMYSRTPTGRLRRRKAEKEMKKK